jgi:chromosome segregation ATPase
MAECTARLATSQLTALLQDLEAKGCALLCAVEEARRGKRLLEELASVRDNVRVLGERLQEAEAELKRRKRDEELMASDVEARSREVSEAQQRHDELQRDIAGFEAEEKRLDDDPAAAAARVFDELLDLREELAGALAGVGEVPCLALGDADLDRRLAAAISGTSGASGTSS